MPKFTKRDLRDPETLCYLCGEPGADTIEHVVPQNLYLDGLGTDPPKAPAHRTCNNSTSMCEEGFRNIIGTVPMHDGDYRLFEKMRRAFENPKAPGMKKDFEKRMIPLPDGSGFVGADNKHVHYTLVKIAKGLAFESSTLLIRPNTVRWSARLFPDPKPVEALGQKLGDPHGLRQVPGVLDAAWWSWSKRLPLVTALRFYGRAVYFVHAHPIANVLGARDLGAFFLPWPRPKGA